MATMIAEVYDAFKAAGVDDEKARKAAEAVASYENKFQDLKTSLLEMKAALLETNERTVRRWVSGDWPVPVPVALLLNLMLDTKKTAEDLRS